MTPPTVTTLPLENARGIMGKISINVPNKKAENEIFTLTFTGIPLTEAQLDAYLGLFTHRSWFNQDAATKLYSPMPWIQRLPKGEFVIEDEFEAEAAKIVVSNGSELVFQADEDDDDEEDEDKAPAVRVSAIVLKPSAGGITLLSCHLQVRPGIGDDNLALQGNQYCPATLTLGSTKLISKGKQQDWVNQGGQPSANVARNEPAAQPAAAAEPESGAETSTPPAADAVGNHGSYLDNDAQMRADHPDAPTMGAVAEGHGAGSDELAQFERDAQTQVAAFNAKPGEVIDGRSERVRHLDEVRGRNGRY